MSPRIAGGDGCERDAFSGNLYRKGMTARMVRHAKRRYRKRVRRYIKEEIKTLQEREIYEAEGWPKVQWLKA